MAPGFDIKRRVRCIREQCAAQNEPDVAERQ